MPLSYVPPPSCQRQTAVDMQNTVQYNAVQRGTADVPKSRSPLSHLRTFRVGPVSNILRHQRPVQGPHTVGAGARSAQVGVGSGSAQVGVGVGSGSEQPSERCRQGGMGARRWRLTGTHHGSAGTGGESHSHWTTHGCTVGRRETPD